MKYMLGFLAAVVLGAIAWVGVVLLGAYNVAATDPHNPVVAWGLDTNFKNNVKRSADDLAPPSEAGEAAMAIGFREYDATCAQCHGAPGVEPHDWSSSMRPHPPDLRRAAEEWSEEEIFWIARHGVKMTGMPAFGPTHTDEQLWAVAAFVNMLPEMNSDTYAQLKEEHGEEGGHQHGG